MDKDYKIEILPDEVNGRYYWSVLRWVAFDTWVSQGRGCCESMIDAMNQAAATYYEVKNKGGFSNG